MGEIDDAGSLILGGQQTSEKRGVFSLTSARSITALPQPAYVEETSPTNLEIALALAGGESTRQPGFALAFGYPGTGKTTFCKALSWHASQAPYYYTHVLDVNCLEMSQLIRNEALVCAQEMSAILFDEKKYPKILTLFEQIDAVSRCPDPAEPQDGRSGFLLTCWVKSLFRHLEQMKRRVFVIGTTDSVLACDPGIKEFLGYLLYLPPPGIATLESMFAAAGLSEPKQIAEGYLVACGSDVRPVHSRVAKAIHAMKTMIPNWQQLPPGDLVNYLYALSVSDLDKVQLIERWEEENADDISRARALKELIEAEKPAEEVRQRA